MDAGFLALNESELRAHMAWLQRLAARLVPGAAEDAVQETLVAALEHPPALDRDVRPWLARVLANFTHGARRAEQRRQRRERAAADAEPGSPGADELLERHEAARVVAGLVSGLREPHRGLVLLRYAEGLTPKQIAGRRGAPEGTVRRQLKEALDELRAAAAAHYRGEERDWRLALVPLLRPRDANPWKGVVLVTMKSKVLLGTAAVALVLVLLLVRGRERAADVGVTAAAAPVAAPVPVRASTALASRAVAATPAPPSFAVAGPDPPGCQERLASLRVLASRTAFLSPAAFEKARPSPASEASVGPIIEGVMSRQPGKPAYQLECRAAVCRVGAVTDPGVVRQPAWLRVLEQDPSFAALRGTNQRIRAESSPTRDALTGAPLLQHWIYFNVPLAPGEEHPFEASATTCGARVAAMQQAMDEQRDDDQRRLRTDRERRQLFERAPVNPELTRRVEAAFRLLGAGNWDCRGEADCRWRGRASVLRALDPPRLNEALSSAGLAADQVTVRVQPGKDGEEGEGELTLRLAEGGRPDGGTATQITRVERKETERGEK